MIHRISANMPSFRTVNLTAGFNVVLADITKHSTKKDSRNGLGKSTLIEIIHFCLGSQPTRNKGLCVPTLAAWEFTVEFDLGSRRVSVTRAVANTKEFHVTGDVEGLGRVQDGVVRLNATAWRELLGEHMFGIPPRSDAGPWSPTFRATFSYIVRRGKGAFLEPFLNDKSQKTWDVQVHNAFLLGIAWEDAQAMQVLREKESAVKALKAAAKAGVIDGMLGNIGQLEADRVHLAEQVEEGAARLESFRVHAEYEQIERRASTLTGEIHSRSNKNVIDTRRLAQLRDAIAEEAQDGSSDGTRSGSPGLTA